MNSINLHDVDEMQKPVGMSNSPVYLERSDNYRILYESMKRYFSYTFTESECGYKRYLCDRL